MAIDYSVFSQIGEGIVLLIAGGFITRLFERRARVVVFYGHVGAFQLQQPQPPLPQSVNTHALVIRNNGRVVAQNLHVTHNGMLGTNNIHVSVYPQIPNRLQTLPNNTEEIFFPTLPAKTQVTISYLYSPPVTYNQINALIYSDERTSQGDQCPATSAVSEMAAGDPLDIGWPWYGDRPLFPIRTNPVGGPCLKSLARLAASRPNIS